MTPKNYFAAPDTYNTDLFRDVLTAAAALAQPFLTVQGYLQVPGAAVNGSQVQYGGRSFTLFDKYDNPSPPYYTTAPGVFQDVWPRLDRFPNAAFSSGTSTFNATIDCVGYACRVLAATGDNTLDGNAYCQLHRTLRATAGTSFPPELGVVPEAYQFAVSLAVLDSGSRGWSYVAGCIDPTQIDIPGYSGRARPGFSAAQPGDIVCFGFVRSGSNGHFMVLAAAPQALDLGSLKAQGVALPAFVTGGYSVSVYDSTNAGTSLHVVDSRRQIATSGIGHGELFLFTNAADEPVGYVFGLEADGSLQPAYFISGAGAGYQSHIVAITVGRYQ
jgi:hypothetical protein